jgi:osmoprotectant transport system ATP-binding protein
MQFQKLLIETMLRLQGVDKTFKGHVALADINLHVKEGEIKVLLGTSGCGKSTILRHMIGLLKPDRGQVLFKERLLGDSDLTAIRQEMGYVIQDGGLFPHLTAGKNAALMATFLKWSEEKITARLQKLAELTQLEFSLLAKFPRQLSGGQRQRVSLMRSLMLDPKIMLMDEPLGALDPITRSELQVDLKNIFKSLEKTVVIVTHDIGEAAYFGHNIVLLKDGQIVQQGTMKELLEKPEHEFVSRFINAQRSPLELMGNP